MSQPDSAPFVQYHGNCHCGAFKFTFKALELKHFGNCDCSICSKNGYMWVHPSGDSFTVVKGDENTTLTIYEFGTGTVAHKFCPTCGTSVMARIKSANKVIVNIRALQDVDFPSLTAKSTFKGSALGEPYQAPAPVPARSPLVGAVEYNGNCHCGSVAYTLLSPKALTSATECNCSLCYRDGAVWTYQPKDNVTFCGLESATEYTFGTEKYIHSFCKICGVAISERFLARGPNGEDLPSKRALNVRTINNLDLSAIKIGLLDGLNLFKPAYQVPA